MDNTARQAQKILERYDIARKGHFVFLSGLHGDYYLDGSLLTPHAAALFQFCQVMAPHFQKLRPEFFISPVDGLSALMALAYRLIAFPEAPEALAFFAHKTPEGEFTLRRQQSRQIAGKRGVVLDDIGTVGTAAKRLAGKVRDWEGSPECVCYLCIRGNISPASVGDVPEVYAPLVLTDLPSWPADQCPLCKEGTPIDMTLGHGKEYVERHGQPVASPCHMRRIGGT